MHRSRLVRQMTLSTTISAIALNAIVIVLVSVLSVPAAARSNEYCPVTTTEKVDPNVWVEYEGQKIFFCCKGCRKDFLADPERYLANLPQFAADTVPGDTSQAIDRSESQPHSHEHGHEVRAATADSALPPDTAAAHGEPAEHEHTVEGDGGQHAEATHDHATDHGDNSDIITWLGKFHPVVIHFPIALVITGFVFAWLGVLYKRDYLDMASINVMYLAAVSAVVSVLLGLAAGARASYPAVLTGYLSWHRILGISSGVLTLISSYLGFRYNKRPSARRGWLYRIALLINSLVIGITGHLGATLIYGPDHFTQ